MAREAHAKRARRKISVEDKQPSSFPSLPGPKAYPKHWSGPVAGKGPRSAYYYTTLHSALHIYRANPCPVPGRVKGASILIPYPLAQANGALLIQGGRVEPREALLRGRSLAPPHSLQGSKPFFNIGDNERGRDRTRE
ncbi:hypothetical protein VNO77_46376 [Canavalia gladiata]|uniref:Uncharacterized protein n=1 Tax=Canavalia gladiata TaxID=3824 RepID=A0AAN9JIP7_CANGL